MNIFEHPKRDSWPALLARPVMDFSTLEGQVQAILDRVRTEGDAALRHFTAEFDRVTLDTLELSKAEIAAGTEQIAADLRQAIDEAAANIGRFHASQWEVSQKVVVRPGVSCWRRSLPIERVGLYIPGGTAPLISTVLMLGVPAQIAGCQEVILCSPPDKNGQLHPGILYAAQVAGVQRIFRVGGAQAIAAMGYGTENIPRMDKIFGPGNQYVTAAKQLLNKSGVAIDLPAGPSELAILADKTAIPEFVAADLLSQAEHGADSQVLLITTSRTLIKHVQAALEAQLQTLPRQSIAEAALQNSRIVYFRDFSSALKFTNAYAAEHLILAVSDPEAVSEAITQAGSVFLGHYTPESAGDYASGTNHTLPTNGFARAYSGVSLDSFLRKITFQQITPEGLEQIGDTVEILAAAESLEAHRRAVSIRRQENARDKS